MVMPRPGVSVYVCMCVYVVRAYMRACVSSGSFFFLLFSCRHASEFLYRNTMLPFTEHWGLYVLGVPKHGFAVWEAIRGGNASLCTSFSFSMSINSINNIASKSIEDVK